MRYSQRALTAILVIISLVLAMQIVHLEPAEAARRAGTGTPRP
jgi:hypothetical protein